MKKFIIWNFLAGFPDWTCVMSRGQQGFSQLMAMHIGNQQYTPKGFQLIYFTVGYDTRAKRHQSIRDLQCSSLPVSVCKTTCLLLLHLSVFSSGWVWWPVVSTVQCSYKVSCSCHWWWWLCLETSADWNGWRHYVQYHYLYHMQRQPWSW